MSDHDLKCAVLLLGMLLGTAGDGNREYDCLVNLEAEQLGPLAAEIAPLDYEIDPADAHQPGVKRRLLEGELLDETSFVYTGRRRATDGTWATEYDYRGRTTSMTSPEAARRIEFVYDPNGRITSRTALRLDGESWILEDRATVLDDDGLPARTTWVWDPIVDRLIAIYEGKLNLKAQIISFRIASTALENSLSFRCSTLADSSIWETAG